MEKIFIRFFSDFVLIILLCRCMLENFNVFFSLLCFVINKFIFLVCDFVDLNEKGDFMNIFKLILYIVSFVFREVILLVLV